MRLLSGKDQRAEFAWPDWLPRHIPELDGLRGIAILAVFFYHCAPRLAGTWVEPAVMWGWTGVNLFFALSGFLITGILLRTPPKNYFRNFYMRRVLRIWPVYYLLLALCCFGPIWLVSTPQSGRPGAWTWAALILFVQNLFHLQLTGSLVPTWSLAIEEQYYVVWAPVVRFLRRGWMLAGVLVVVLAMSPMVRMDWGRVLEPSNTLVQLDCVAFGSLLAVGMLRLRWSRVVWLWIGVGSAAVGFAGVASFANGTVFMGSAIGLGFSGLVMTAIAGTGARNPVGWLLRHGPLPFYGRISYGMYLMHIAVIIWLGWLDKWVDKSGIVGGNLMIVGARLLACTLVAMALWFGLEKRVLRLKRYFPAQT